MVVKIKKENNKLKINLQLEKIKLVNSVDLLLIDKILWFTFSIYIAIIAVFIKGYFDRNLSSCQVILYSAFVFGVGVFLSVLITNYQRKKLLSELNEIK